MKKSNIILIIVSCVFILLCLMWYNKHYEGFSSNMKLYENNLLTNTLFDNGANIKEFYKNKGSNKIIRFENNPMCDTSSYVLEQSSNNGLNAYILKKELNKNYNYRLTMWVAFEKTNNISKLLSIKSLSNEVDNCDNDVEVREKIISMKNVKGVDWYKYQYIFNIGNMTDVLLYIGCAMNLTGKRYITNIVLIPFLPMSPNFEGTIGLKTYLDGSNKNSCNESLFWNDLSNKDAKYQWSVRPTWDNEGYYKTLNNMLMGTALNELDINYANNVEFSIVLYSKNIGLLGEKDVVYNNVIQVDGNQGIGLQISLPNKNGIIKMILGGKEYETKNYVNTISKIIYTFIHKDNNFEIWLNDELFETFSNVPKLHFENNKLIINKNKDWNANIYGLLLYNKLINEQEIKYINNFLIYHPNPAQKIVPPPQPYVPANPLKPSGNNTPSVPITPANGGSGGGSGDGNCPTVSVKDGNFLVNIPKMSVYAKKLGFGFRNYGKDKRNASKIYSENFPDCSLPELLIFNPVENCPFIIGKNNPCDTDDCLDVDWTTEANMNKKCMRNISHYCFVNKNTDLSCMCWQDKYKNDAKCLKYRQKYEDPNDYGFSINNFSIDEHPDFSKYIKKTAIPCWGCNLTEPAENGTYVKNRSWSKE